MPVKSFSRSIALPLMCAITLSAHSCARTRNSIALTITPVEDTVRLVRTPEVVYFRVSAVLRNADTRTLLVGECGPLAQREISGAWITVYRPICVGHSHWSLLPGDSAVIAASVSGFTAPNTGPQLDPRMVAGRYRLLFSIASVDKSGTIAAAVPTDVAASSPFVVEDDS